MNKLAIVTGTSTGIGLELAKLAAGDGYDLVVATAIHCRQAAPSTAKSEFFKGEKHKA